MLKKIIFSMLTVGLVLAQEPDVVIIDLDPTSTGEALKSALNNIYSGEVEIAYSLDEYSLLGMDAVFVLLGIFSNNTVISAGSEALLIEYLDSGGNLYMEGGDMWYYDPQFQGGYDFGPLFGINAVSDGSADLSQVTGYDFLEGMSWNYSSENNWIDQLSPAGNAVAVFSNDQAGYDCGIAYDAGNYRTVGTSFEITGLGGTNNLEDAVEGILEFFDVLGSDPEYTIDFSTTITATDDLGSIPLFELTIGTSPEATLGYDDGLDIYAPPPPPPPAWDAALYNMEINDRFYADYRPTTPTDGNTVWAIDFQAESGSSEYILTWDPNSLGDGNFTLTDPFGGNILSVDMKNNNSAIISTMFNRVLVTHAYYTIDFSTTITATDDLGSIPLFELTIGTSPEATLGYDDGLDIYAPPPPPPPAWDAALYNMEINDRFYADYRPTTPTDGNTVWAIDFQAESGSSEYILTWDPNSLGDGNFTLTDPFGGNMLSVDMKNNNSAIISTMFNRVLVTHAYYTIDFSTTITTTDDLGSIPLFELTIGTSPDATLNYDVGLDIYAPPPPPPPAWDAALYNMEINDRFYADYRPTTPTSGNTVWAIDFQAESGSSEYILTWDPNSLGDGNFTLTDPFGGNILSVDMKNNNSATISTMFNRVLITHAYYSFDFLTVLTATDDAGSEPFELSIGTIQNATDGYDEGLDVYAPPAPPPPSWDAALFNPIINDRFYMDIRPTTPEDGFTEWAVDFQADEGSEEINLSWNIDALGDGNFSLTDAFGGMFFSVNMNSTNYYSFPISFTRVFIRHSFISDIEVSYMADWNLVGLPLEVEDASSSNLFPESINGTLYSFGEGYILESTLVHGEGYWLRFENTGSTTIDGTPINELTISLNEDWNLVSGLSEDISIYSVSDPDSIIIPGTLYGFNEGYVESDILVPGKGYWVRAFEAGEITLANGALAKTAPRDFSLKGKANSLTVNGMDLYFGVEISASDKLSYSLPPKPPSGAFDVRFSGDTKIAMDKAEIEVMNPSQTLTISYDIIIDAGDHMNWVLSSESNKEYTLEGTGEITIPSAEKFVLNREPVIPITFTLHQNYPNPFNPITSLHYDLPEQAQVTLTVYDMLGREITQLVNTTQDAGYRLVQWDATDSFGKPVSAGVYLYQIQAGEFVQTRKMVLLK